MCILMSILMNRCRNKLNIFQLKMTSILGTGTVTPVFVGSQISTLVIVLAIVFVIVVLIGVALYLTFTDYTTNGVRGTTVRFKCAPGQCITNLFSGEKICPQDANAVLTTDPATEVCNSRFTCENTLTPYAEQIDGSTDPLGNCPEGVECRCLRKPRCGNHILTSFSTLGGNPYLPLEGQLLTFKQNTSYVATVTDSNGNLSSTLIAAPPLELSNPKTDFCSVPVAWKPRLNPRKCVRGVLAYLPDDPLNFDFDNTSLGCVPRGTECPDGDIEVWDPRVNFQVCTYNGGSEQIRWTCPGLKNGTLIGVQKLLSPTTLLLYLAPISNATKFRYPDTDPVANKYYAKKYKTNIPRRFWPNIFETTQLGIMKSRIYNIRTGAPDGVLVWNLVLQADGKVVFTPSGNYTVDVITQGVFEFSAAMLVVHSAV